MNKILRRQKRNFFEAVSYKEDILIVLCTAVCITFAVFKIFAVPLTLVKAVCVLSGLVVYLLISIPLFLRAVKVIQWYSDEIIVAEDALYVMHSGECSGKICWDDVQEAGLVPAKGGPKGSPFYSLYFSTHVLEKPPYFHASNIEKYRSTPNVISFSSNNFSYLDSVLPQLKPWVDCILDTPKRQKMENEKSISVIYMRCNHDEATAAMGQYMYMTCDMYERLWAVEREKAMLYSIKRWIGILLNIMCGVIAVLSLF